MTTPSVDPGKPDEAAPAGGVARLVARAQSGSRADYAEIVHRFHGRLFNFLLRRTGSTEDAEDLTQDAFVRAWQRLDQYDPRWQFSTWLFTIAARLAITHHRRRTSMCRSPAAPDPATTGRDDPAQVIADREQGQDLWRLADEHLGETARAALWLRYAEDLAPRDIARVLDRSQVAVRVMLHRARTVLAARAFDADDVEDKKSLDRSERRRRVSLRDAVTGGL